MEILRPYGIVLDGQLQLGLEVVREPGGFSEIRPHTGIPENFVLSLPFVNAHSHLEYRGFQGRLSGLAYWEWIRELTRRKALQTDSEVLEDCRKAADENVRTGVRSIWEHSDRPFAGEAMADRDLSGRIFQEVITFFERESREDKLASIRKKAEATEATFRGDVELSPHALYTVDPETLRMFGASGRPFSIHLAESTFERAFFERGEGPIADFYRANQIPFEAGGHSPVEVAQSYGLLRVGAQLVHCCDLSPSDIGLIAQSGAAVAHCPRSNEALGCPPAPIRELIDAGVAVGLGMDSAASSGPIDMFAEMRAAMAVSEKRGRPLKGEEVWRMATTMGRKGFESGYNPGPGPVLAIQVANAHSTDELIAHGSPEAVRWIA